METLQVVWFLLIALLLTIYFVLDGFDLGVGAISLFSTKDDDNKELIKTIAPFWDGNEVWLLTGGGAVFAAFPSIYATVFSTFYFPLVLILAALMFRAVGIDFRNKIDIPLWAKFWDKAFAWGSVVPAFLFGVAAGNILKGFAINSNGDYLGSFFGLLNTFSIVVGLTLLSLITLHGTLYAALKTNKELLKMQLVRRAKRIWSFVIVLVIVSSVWMFVSIRPEFNIYQIITFILAIITLLYLRIILEKNNYSLNFALSTTVMTLMLVLFFQSIFPIVVMASNDANFSLTIYNSSASLKSLKTMLVIAIIGMPIVIGYTIFIYRLFANKRTLELKK